MLPRTELEILLNEPVYVRLSNDWLVEVREPTNAELGEYLAMMNDVVRLFLGGNAPLIRAALAGEDVAQIPFDLSALGEATARLVARIVARDVNTVRNEMSGRQCVAIINAFLGVLGWDFIRETFRQATTAYRASGTTRPSESAAGPPWPVESSPSSRPPTRG